MKTVIKNSSEEIIYIYIYRERERERERERKKVKMVQKGHAVA
jgi:hypothetical protein